MSDVKQQLIDVGQQWIAKQIDMAVKANPRLSFISRRLKDGLSNTLANKIDIIDPYLPFLTDDKGQFNIKSISGELLNAFDEMPIKDVTYMGLNMQIGKGSIVVMFPDNIFTNLFLDNNKLVVEKVDILDLINSLK